MWHRKPQKYPGISDLINPDITFVNRQRGAGTRILLDLELKKLGIGEDRISGYEHEEYTHMGVAASVANSVADVGLGIRSAARALGLDFVPVAWERYDLLMTKEFLHSSLMDKLFSVMSSEDFKNAVLSSMVMMYLTAGLCGRMTQLVDTFDVKSNISECR